MQLSKYKKYDLTDSAHNVTCRNSVSFKVGYTTQLSNGVCLIITLWRAG